MYLDFTLEYENVCHVTEDSRSLNLENEVNYFLLHHSVIGEYSTTAKLRTVCYASAKTTSSFSFNDIQMVGTTIQDDLLSILLSFRQHKYIIPADIEKMYKAVEVNRAQMSPQRKIFQDVLQIH